MQTKINCYLSPEGTGKRQDQNKVVQRGIHEELRGKEVLWIEVGMSEGKDLHRHSCGVTHYVQCNLVSLKTSSSLKKRGATKEAHSFELGLPRKY